MTNESAKRIRTIFGILLSLSIVVAGICLITACVGIYQTGEHPFSREAVAEAFSGIALPVYLCLGLVILGFILEPILPVQNKKLTAAKQNSLILKRLHSKVDLSQCDEALRSGVAAQQKSRRLRRCVTAVLLSIGSVIFLIYALNGENFHQSKINDSMIRAMGILLPCIVIPFVWAVFASYRNAASMEEEIALLKQAEVHRSEPVPSPAPKTCPAAMIRNIIMIVAIVSLIFGFLTGGTADVLTKAVNICTECVGLG